MESLSAYGNGSDDEYEEVVEQPKKQVPPSASIDVNYDQVQMDLSDEESNDSARSGRASCDAPTKEDTDRTFGYEKRNLSDKKSSSRRSPDDKYRKHTGDDDRHTGRNRGNSRNQEYRKDNRGSDDRSSRHRDDKYRRSRYDDQERSKTDDRSRSHHNSSRERQKSRSPRRADYRSRRSDSRDRSSKPTLGTNYSASKRYDRTSSKMDRLEKLGIELNTSGSSNSSQINHQINDDNNGHEKDRFFMPGITGRFTEQIQRRKMLWQKKDPPTKPEDLSVKPTSVPLAQSTGQKIWQNTTFAQDTDGKVANKFKRLMGIRGSGAGVSSGTETTVRPVQDTLKKQEEMFNSMEAQYEVARTATHTMRGVGFGFGSFQR